MGSLPAVTRTSFWITVRQESRACPGRGWSKSSSCKRVSPSPRKALKWGVWDTEDEVSLDWEILLLNQPAPPVYVIGTFHEQTPLPPPPSTGGPSLAPNTERTLKSKVFGGRKRR